MKRYSASNHRTLRFNYHTIIRYCTVDLKSYLSAYYHILYIDASYYLTVLFEICFALHKRNIILRLLVAHTPVYYQCSTPSSIIVFNNTTLIPKTSKIQFQSDRIVDLTYNTRIQRLLCRRCHHMVVKLLLVAITMLQLLK